MAYIDNIPQPNDQLRNSQGDLLGNFQAIDTYTSVNHVPFNTGADDGKHTVINLVDQLGALPPFQATETGFFSNPYAASTQNETYVKINNFAATQFIPMTASVLGTAAPISGLAGWTYLPSGIMMKWFHWITPAGGVQTVVIPATPNMGPAFTNIFNVQLTMSDPNLGVVDEFARVMNIANPLQFTVMSTQRTTNANALSSFYVLVIGV